MNLNSGGVFVMQHVCMSPCWNSSTTVLSEYCYCYLLSVWWTIFHVSVWLAQSYETSNVLGDSIITTDNNEEVRTEAKTGEVKGWCKVMLTDCQIVLQGFQGHSCLKSIIPLKFSHGSLAFTCIRTTCLWVALHLIYSLAGVKNKPEHWRNSTEVTARLYSSPARVKVQ